jgi:hypothetical protein
MKNLWVAFDPPEFKYFYFNLSSPDQTYYMFNWTELINKKCIKLKTQQLNPIPCQVTSDGLEKRYLYDNKSLN